MSIKNYLLTAMLCLICGQMMLFGGIFYFVQRHSAARSAELQQSDALEKLQAVCRESILRTSPFAAINYCNILAKDSVIRFAECADFNGRIVAHTDPDQIGGYLARASAALTASRAGSASSGAGASRVLERFAPVMVQNRRAGTVSIGFDQTAIERQIAESLWDVLGRFVLASIAALAIVIGTSLFLARSLALPITKLAEGARSIAAGRKGDQIPIELGRVAEFRSLIMEFNRMAERLHELDRLKENFLAGITHDLKAPLVGIQGHTEMMMNEAVSDAQARHLQTIHENSHRLRLFVNDILDLSRLEAGALELQKTSVDLSALAASVTELYSAKAQAYGIRLEAKFPPDMPRAFADSALIRRVLDNLLSNALKFTPSGGQIVVLGFLFDQAHGSSHLLVEVRDSGPGIPPDRLESVFEKFVQAESRHAARDEGSGLGLAISKEIVLAHGGRIWAGNREGEGSYFCFTLPRA